MDDFLKFIVENGGVIAVLVILVLVLSYAVKYLFSLVIDNFKEQQNRLNERISNIEKITTVQTETLKGISETMKILTVIAKEVEYLSRENTINRMQGSSSQIRLLKPDSESTNQIHEDGPGKSDD